jgi:glycine dehydrogenase
LTSPALKLKQPRGEAELLAEFRSIMDRNQVYRSFIGAGYHDTITPPVVLRNILENPLWYTAYTPYVRLFFFCLFSSPRRLFNDDISPPVA